VSRASSQEGTDWEVTPSRIVFDAPDRLTDISSWHTHIPFAFWCIETLQPRIFVELGTHKGDSYAAFCQAVKRLSLPTACYAVDTWKGDHEAGYYGDEVLEDLRAYHDPRYAAFSRLVRSTFDEAMGHFADGSIDLLHIDGLHTYEAVSHDFETWLPKLSSRGVVLFHDVNVRESDFGAWRFWEDVSARYPHFTFLHGHGLGVLQVGDDAPEPIRRLVACSPDAAAGPRDFFARLGHQVQVTAEVRRVKALLEAAEQGRADRDIEVARLEAALADQRSATVELQETADRERDLAARRLADQREESRRSTAAAEMVSEQRLEVLRAERNREVEMLRGELEALRADRDRHLASWPARLARGAASLARIPKRVGHALAIVVETLGWAARFKLRQGLRLRKHARMIRRAWLLDPAYYLAQCGEDEAARRDPIRHYLQHGADRGLDPNPFFDTSYYVERNRAVADYGKNPLIHFIRQGGRLKLNPSPAFVTAYYLEQCPYARTSGLNPLSHYLVHGRQAGYRCSPQVAVGEDSRAAEGMDLQKAPGLLVPMRDRVLVVDHRMLMPDQDSGSVRMFAIIKLLNELGHEVTFVAENGAPDGRYERALGRYASKIIFGQEWTRAHLFQEGGSYRFAILSRPEQTDRFLPLVRALAPQATVVYDTVDLHWVRLTRAAELTGDRSLLEEAERFRRLEQANVSSSDLVLAITDRERATLLAQVPGANVEVIPNIHAVRPVRRPLDGRKDLFFIGGYEHTPNVDAVLWFVAEILPRIRLQLPDVLFHVVGSRPTEEVRKLASSRVRVAGYVADPDTFFECSRVFVSPLRYGAGMKGKIGQAMTHGLPVVTTSIGAEGMRLVDGETALVANGAAEFADAVIRLYADSKLWVRLSENSRMHVEAHFSEDAVRPMLAKLFPRSERASPVRTA
jgi:glycosyltransferase involved in cell wall biosynthesis